MNKKDIEALSEKLKRCREIPLDEVNPDDVDEITDIKIDKRKSSNERILEFLMKTKNPSYNIIVKLENLFGLSHRELFFLVENTL